MGYIYVYVCKYIYMYVCVYVFIISQARPQGNNNCHAVGHPWAPLKKTRNYDIRKHAMQW